MHDDDPLTESLDNLFHRNAAKPLARPSGKKRSGTTPHAKLKKDCRKALRENISNGAAVIVPIQNMLMEMKDGRKFKTGRKGAGDDIYLVRGTAFAVEYKASWKGGGHDTQSSFQETFQAKWEKAGGVYVIARDPQQLVADVAAALAARHRP